MSDDKIVEIEQDLEFVRSALVVAGFYMQGNTATKVSQKDVLSVVQLFEEATAALLKVNAVLNKKRMQ